MATRRVVVTGMGTVNPLGLTVADTWAAILNSQSGVKTLPELVEANFPTTIAAPTANFDSSLYLDEKDARRMDPFIQYGFVAAQQALKDSQFIIDEFSSLRVGVAIGSGIGGLPGLVKNEDTLRDKGVRKISPFFIPGCIINIAAGFVAIELNCKGPNISIVSACTTGCHNIGYAARTIAYGDADAMLAGGTEMATIPLGIGGFAALRALSTRNDAPLKASRPWDKDRDGFVLADGAAVLMLEEYEHAKKRGAPIYAELVGFGMSDDAYHLTMPSQEGMQHSMQNALRDAKLSVEDIDYINAHATSTPAGDPVEVQAVKATFGQHAYRLCMSSTKSMTGHLLGAAGAIEAIFSILALRDQVAPPTINLDHPDEGCDLNLVPHTAQSKKISTVLSNSFGFGGTNGTLIFKAV